MKDLSARTGIPDRTIRYYIDDGLFIPEKYTENYKGRRSYVFSENDVKRLKQIALLRKYGFSIEEIKALEKGGADIPALIASRIAEEKQNAEAQRESIQVLESLTRKNPQDMDELCTMLFNPVAASVPAPLIDNQAAYKPMLKRARSINVGLLIFFIVAIVLSCYATAWLIFTLQSPVNSRNADLVKNELGIEDEKKLGKFVTVFKDPAAYHYVKELTGLRLSDFKEDQKILDFNQSALFPRRIDDKNVREFYCEYYEYMPLGEGCQFLLEIQYDEESFAREKERLSRIEGGRIRFDETNFAQPAYVTVYSEGYLYEYALIKENERSVSYVYLFDVNEKDLVLDPGYLPKEYHRLDDIILEDSFDVYAARENKDTLTLSDERELLQSVEIKEGDVFFRCSVPVKNHTDQKQTFRMEGYFGEKEHRHGEDYIVENTDLIKECWIYARDPNDLENRAFEIAPGEKKTFEVCFIGTQRHLNHTVPAKLSVDITFEPMDFR